jgi:hypothetical protein
MITYTNECVDCGLPCLGSDCPLRNTPHCYCDICGQEIYEEDIAYRNDDYIICVNCDYQEEII